MANNKYNIQEATIVPVDNFVRIDGYVVEMEPINLPDGINAIQVKDGIAYIEFEGDRVDSTSDNLDFLNATVAEHKDQKVIQEARKTDPLYGRKGEDRKKWEKALDLKKAKDEHRIKTSAPVSVFLPDKGTMQFPATYDFAMSVLLARESALLSATPDVKLIDYNGTPGVFTVHEANRILGVVGQVYHDSLVTLKDKEKKIKDR